MPHQINSSRVFPIDSSSRMGLSPFSSARLFQYHRSLLWVFVGKTVDLPEDSEKFLQWRTKRQNPDPHILEPWESELARKLVVLSPFLFYQWVVVLSLGRTGK